MNCRNYILSLFVIAMLASIGEGATDEEPAAEKQSTVVQTQPSTDEVRRSPRTFGRLLQKGQWVTLHTIRRETPSIYQYQVRIVTEKQMKQIENLVAVRQKELEDMQSKGSVLREQMQIETDEVKQAELRKAFDEVNRGSRARRLPLDCESGRFYKISDVGADYAGFERNGVEVFHRLSSIHMIIRGLEDE